MQLVILGQKKQRNGQTVYRTFQNNKYERTPKVDLVPGQTVTTLVSPFPFEIFSSLDFDYEAESFKTYKPCYLLVEAKVSQHKLNQMASGNKRSHLFYNCQMTFLSEFNKPFEYALAQYHQYRKLDTWDLVTWLPHQKIRSEAEFEAMSEIFEIDYAKQLLKGYTQSISFDKYIIPYLPQLVDKPNLKFGDGGYFKSDIGTLSLIDTLPVDKLIAFVHKYVYDINTLMRFWLKHPMLGEAWFWDQLTDVNSAVSKAILDRSYDIYHKIPGFDWKRLMNWYYDIFQSHDKRDLTAFFNSSSIEAEYQREEKAYQDYVAEHADDDEDDEWDDWYDDYDDYDPDEVYPPYDKRVQYLGQYLQRFRDVLPMSDFKARFPMVPAVVWERFEANLRN